MYVRIQSWIYLTKQLQNESTGRRQFPRYCTLDIQDNFYNLVSLNQARYLYVNLFKMGREIEHFAIVRIK